MTCIGKLAALAAFTALTFPGAVLGAPVEAAAEPATECVTDDSVPNEITLSCPPGAGAGQHAFIRCRDIGGLAHTRIGPALGAEGGVSRANCAARETGPA
ncbi:hypothetical protein [Nocardia crassostreae]|uniref:hypothetical protein n=1 Tax=Nocardia crassostreae TaxID=53428 RepID=UPI000830739B|nr:hypothetical protein [Nocardia crassostreae]